MPNSSENTLDPDDDHWEIYVTFVNESPAVILVDIGIEKAVPIAALPKLVWIHLFLRDVDEEGFASEEEDMRLNEIEDALNESVGDMNVRYVGRITSVSRREFYFYTDDFESFQRKTVGTMGSFADYAGYEIDETDDEAWEHYSNVLYPAPEDFQQIHNQNVIMRLQQDGDTLTTPRRVDHFANFKNEQDRESFAAAAEAAGFEVVSRPENKDDAEFLYSVDVMRVDSVDPETVDRVTYELFELAETHNGEYDGWASPVVKPT